MGVFIVPHTVMSGKTMGGGERWERRRRQFTIHRLGVDSQRLEVLRGCPNRGFGCEETWFLASHCWKHHETVWCGVAAKNTIRGGVDEKDNRTGLSVSSRRSTGQNRGEPETENKWKPFSLSKVKKDKTAGDKKNSCQARNYSRAVKCLISWNNTELQQSCGTPILVGKTTEKKSCVK